MFPGCCLLEKGLKRRVGVVPAEPPALRARAVAPYMLGSAQCCSPLPVGLVHMAPESALCSLDSGLLFVCLPLSAGSDRCWVSPFSKTPCGTWGPLLVGSLERPGFLGSAQCVEHATTPEAGASRAGLCRCTWGVWSGEDKDDESRLFSKKSTPLAEAAPSGSMLQSAAHCEAGLRVLWLERGCFRRYREVVCDVMAWGQAWVVLFFPGT